MILLRDERRPNSEALVAPVSDPSRQSVRCAALCGCARARVCPCARLGGKEDAAKP
jgi:hypothetical protein